MEWLKKTVSSAPHLKKESPEEVWRNGTATPVATFTIEGWDVQLAPHPLSVTAAFLVDEHQTLKRWKEEEMPKVLTVPGLVATIPPGLGQFTFLFEEQQIWSKECFAEGKERILEERKRVDKLWVPPKPAAGVPVPPPALAAMAPPPSPSAPAAPPAQAASPSPVAGPSWKKKTAEVVVVQEVIENLTVPIAEHLFRQMQSKMGKMDKEIKDLQKELLRLRRQMQKEQAQNAAKVVTSRITRKK